MTTEKDPQNQRVPVVVARLEAVHQQAVPDRRAAVVLADAALAVVVPVHRPVVGVRGEALGRVVLVLRRVAAGVRGENPVVAVLVLQGAQGQVEEGLVPDVPVHRPVAAVHAEGLVLRRVAAVLGVQALDHGQETGAPVVVLQGAQGQVGEGLVPGVPALVLPVAAVRVVAAPVGVADLAAIADRGEVARPANRLSVDGLSADAPSADAPSAATVVHDRVPKEEGHRGLVAVDVGTVEAGTGPDAMIQEVIRVPDAIRTVGDRVGVIAGPVHEAGTMTAHNASFRPVQKACLAT